MYMNITTEDSQIYYPCPKCGKRLRLTIPTDSAKVGDGSGIRLEHQAPTCENFEEEVLVQAIQEIIENVESWATEMSKNG